MKKWTKRIALLCAALLLLLLAAAAGLLYLLTARVQGQFFDSNGVPIHYTIEGNGNEHVILIHGLAAQADLNWRRPGITSLLARNYKVIMFDLRGHGLSGKPLQTQDYGIELVNDVIRLMDHLNIQRAHIAGYSLGGFIALKLATQHPQRVITAAYCASGWKDPDDPADIRSPYRPPDYPDTYKDTNEKNNQKQTQEQDNNQNQKKDSPQTASTLNLDFLSDPMDQLRDAIGERIMPRAVRKALRASVQELIVTKENLKKNTTPSICFIGTRDGLLPYATALKEHTPKLDLVLLQNADHITTAINNEFHQKLLSFLQQHPEQKN